jgi:hypothetical protein
MRVSFSNLPAKILPRQKNAHANSAARPPREKVLISDMDLWVLANRFNEREA